LLYSQFSGAQSLREIETALASHRGGLYHLGARSVSRSTLADANAHRPGRFSSSSSSTWPPRRTARRAARWATPCA
jgi:hypothetical protein